MFGTHKVGFHFGKLGLLTNNVGYDTLYLSCTFPREFDNIGLSNSIIWVSVMSLLNAVSLPIMWTILNETTLSKKIRFIGDNKGLSNKCDNGLP